ncbi:hypothetical protein GQ44DRAFT_593415, partial [Phaeosphaeriaceae sp. PMI808]
NYTLKEFPYDIINNSLSAMQFDFAQEVPEYRPFPVNEQVNGAILYKDNPCPVPLPYLAGGWNGSGMDMPEARLQSAYSGPAPVYDARNHDLSYLGRPGPPGHAEVTTFTTDGTNPNVFAHYAAKPEDGLIGYYQYPISSTNLASSHQAFQGDGRGFRNTQDHPRDQSYALRDNPEQHGKQRCGDLQP